VSVVQRVSRMIFFEKCGSRCGTTIFKNFTGPVTRGVSTTCKKITFRNISGFHRDEYEDDLLSP
jgi:hypothetical protein